MPGSDGDQGFLSRWSRRKTQARLASQGPKLPLPDSAQPAQGAPETSQPQPVSQVPTDAAAAAIGSPPAEQLASEAAQEPAPTMADVAQLTPESDFTRFVRSDVQTDVKNAALKRLFSDPHFNRMDGLDVYIDDYNVPDPLPPSMLRKMAQAEFLGLVTQASKKEGATALDPLKPDAGEAAPRRADLDTPPADRIAAHENADLQLQPDDDAGQPCAAPSVDRDAGREH